MAEWMKNVGAGLLSAFFGIFFIIMTWGTDVWFLGVFFLLISGFYAYHAAWGIIKARKGELPEKPKRKAIDPAKMKKVSRVDGDIGLFIFMVLLTLVFLVGSLIEMASPSFLMFLLIGLVLLGITIYLTKRTKKKLDKLGFKTSNFIKPGTDEVLALKEALPVAGGLVILLIIAAVFLMPFLEDFSWGGGNYVEVSGVSFTAPTGWDVDTSPGGGMLVEVIGPDEGNTQAYFGVEKDFYVGTFDNAVENTTMDEFEEMGATLLTRSTTYVGGKYAKEYVYRFYKESKGYYAKGKLISVDLGDGEAIGITFVCKEDLYYSNLEMINGAIASMQFR